MSWAKPPVTLWVTSNPKVGGHEFVLCWFTWFVHPMAKTNKDERHWNERSEWTVKRNPSDRREGSLLRYEVIEYMELRLVHPTEFSDETRWPDGYTLRASPSGWKTGIGHFVLGLRPHQSMFLFVWSKTRYWTKAPDMKSRDIRWKQSNGHFIRVMSNRDTSYPIIPRPTTTNYLHWRQVIWPMHPRQGFRFLP